MNEWRRIVAVFLKELLDSMRDRRSLMSSLMFPLFGPLMIAATLSYVVSEASEVKPLELPVVGAEHAPGLMAHLEQSGVEVQPAPADPEGSVRDGDLDVVLIVPEDYGERFRAARPAGLQLVVDRSRNEAASDIRRAERLIETYAGKIGMMRLLARGVNPAVARPVMVEDVDMATPQRMAARVFNMIPMFVLLAAFIGGMYVATDATAGERERKSLEPLLINPVPRRVLVLGKWMATTVFGVVGVVLTLVFSLVALRQVPLEEVGISSTLGLAEGLAVLFATLPVALLGAAIQMLVASFAKSFREAQTYLSFMLFLPMLPGLFLSLKPMGSEPWMWFVPVLGHQVLVMDIVRGEPVSGLGFAVSGLVALLGTGLCLWVTTVLFRRESMVFGS